MSSHFLDVSDLYDFYGLSAAEGNLNGPEELNTFAFFLESIRDKYIATLKKRIIEEAGYIGLDLKGDSIEAMCRRVKDHLKEEISRQAQQMAMMGTGFKMMDFLKKMEGDKKPDPMMGAADAFRSKEGKSRAMFGGEPWAKISEAFLAIEKAKTSSQIILAIDTLNDLQHNCCHVIFDLTGTRGGGGDSHAAVQEILNEKKHARTPKDYSSKMSADVKKFLKANHIL